MVTSGARALAEKPGDFSKSCIVLVDQDRMELYAYVPDPCDAFHLPYKRTLLCHRLLSLRLVPERPVTPTPPLPPTPLPLCVASVSDRGGLEGADTARRTGQSGRRAPVRRGGSRGYAGRFRIARRPLWRSYWSRCPVGSRDGSYPPGHGAGCTGPACLHGARQAS